MSQDSSIAIADIWHAIRALDQSDAYTTISYNMTTHNTLTQSAPWWVSIPFGKSPLGGDAPKTSPFEDAILQAISNGGTDHCFVDIIHLWSPEEDFFYDTHAPTTIVDALAQLVNNQPQDARPVIRYLEGYLGGNPHPGYSGLAQAFYKHKVFTHKKACLYYGSFAPGSLPSSSEIEAVAETLWESLVARLKKTSGLESGMDSKLMERKQDITSWTSGFIQAASVPSLNMKIPPPSWNHSKIFAVNGKTLVTGGANYWNVYGTGQKWLFDLSMSITGDAAIDAHYFANYIWRYLENIPSSDTLSFSQANPLTGDINGFKKSRAPQFPTDVQNEGNIHVLSAGKNGNWSIENSTFPAETFNGIRDFLLNVFAVLVEAHNWRSEYTVLATHLLDDDDPAIRTLLGKRGITPAAWASRYARNYALKKAQNCIRLSQQKIVMDDLAVRNKDWFGVINALLGTNWNGYIWPYDTLMALGYGLSNISHATSPTGIQLVTSCPSPKDGYEDPVTAKEFLNRLATVMTDMQALKYINPAGSVADVIKQFFAYKRIDQNDGYGNHSKLVVVDDSVCYVGSDNAYPCYCQEFGLWIDDQPSIKSFLSGYWNGLWGFAKPAQ